MRTLVIILLISFNYGKDRSRSIIILSYVTVEEDH